MTKKVIGTIGAGALVLALATGCPQAARDRDCIDTVSAREVEPGPCEKGEPGFMWVEDTYEGSEDDGIDSGTKAEKTPAPKKSGRR